MTPRRGRPRKPAQDLRSTNLTVRLTVRELELLRAAASREWLSLSEWIRQLLLGHAGPDAPRNRST